MANFISSQRKAFRTRVGYFSDATTIFFSREKHLSAVSLNAFMFQCPIIDDHCIARATHHQCMLRRVRAAFTLWRQRTEARHRHFASVTRALDGGVVRRALSAWRLALAQSQVWSTHHLQEYLEFQIFLSTMCCFLLDLLVLSSVGISRLNDCIWIGSKLQTPIHHVQPKQRSIPVYAGFSLSFFFLC
jgi:hypothetical protein